jgi:hypothetical protein
MQITNGKRSFRSKIIQTICWVAAAYLLVPSAYLAILVGLLAAWIMILEGDLLYRSAMIDIMDEQLVKVSADVDRLTMLEHEVSVLRERLNDIQDTPAYRNRWK